MVIDSHYIISRSKHHVTTTDISQNALNVLARLNKAGFQAYLVGGGVRDLLLRHTPKDFDIATNATPQNIRTLFRNARIIGRRFKLAHILCHKEIIEVTTFRGAADTNENQFANEHGMLVRDNVYGSLEDDAWRRDFTINALYYHPEDGSIIDYTGGVNDVNNQCIRIIGDPVTRYQEDPVRMLRAVRFAAKLNFTMEEKTEKPLFELNTLISHISGSRLFDEMVKMYQCTAAVKAQALLEHYGLFAHLFPATHALLSNDTFPTRALLTFALESTDRRLGEGKPVNPAFIYAILLWFPLRDRVDCYIKEGLEPLAALEAAMSHVIRDQNLYVTISKRHAQTIRDIWLMQYRLPKRLGIRAHQLLKNPRFRAGYDFLALRALVNDAPMDLAEWWTTFQDASADDQAQMIQALESAATSSATKKRKKRKKANH